jgi:signal transduction histidine kinase
MRPDDILLLESIAPVAARLLVISRNAIQQRTEAEERAIQAIVDSEIDELAEETRTAKEVLQANLEQAQIQIRELNKLVKALEADADKERQRVAELLQDSEEAMSITQRIETISAERSQLRAERENLANALIEAKASLVTATAEDDVLVFQGMIEELQREVDELTQQKHALEERLVRIREADDTSQASQKLNALIESLTAEKAQLATDRDLLQNQLRQTRAQLESLGIEDGVVGLAKQLAHLTEERLYYKAQAEKATQEREVLLAERRKLEEAIAAETNRSARIRTLEEEVARLGQDREALIKSRDSLKIEREAFLAERDMWRGERARLLAQTDALRMELDETLDLLRQANEERQENNARIHELTAEFDNLRATRTRVENERDALLARIQGDRERLKEVGAEGVGALTKIIEELSQERKTLEDKLSQMQAELNNLKWETIKLREVQPDQLQSGSVDAGTINTMAQELIAPISAISHYADMLLGESVGGLSALQHQFMMRVKSNLERLNQLIGDLVQASSLLYKGALELKPQPLNLLDLIDDAITDSRFKFSEKGIILDLDIPDEVLQVEADSAAMRQVIRHLIDNAYLVSPNDSSVRLSAHYHNNGQQQVLVAISDHGGGVDPALHEQVFSQMNRADNTIIKGVGHSGIELSLVKGLIEAHNGKIWLETEVGIGTTFSFTVPTRFEE